MSERIKTFANFFSQHVKDKADASMRRAVHKHVNPENVEEFLEQANVFVDSLGASKNFNHLWRVIEMTHEVYALFAHDEGLRKKCDQMIFDWIVPHSKTVTNHRPFMYDREDAEEWAEKTIALNKNLEKAAYRLFIHKTLNSASLQRILAIWEQAIDIVYKYDVRGAKDLLKGRNHSHPCIVNKLTEFKNLDTEQVALEEARILMSRANVSTHHAQTHKIHPTPQ